MALLLEEHKTAPAGRTYQPLGKGHTIWLFAGHDAAAKNQARLWSLIASAERHAIDPQRYLTSVLAKLPLLANPDGSLSADELTPFLPDVWKRDDAAEPLAPEA